MTADRKKSEPQDNGLREAAQRAREREHRARREHEVPIGQRLAQIGILGWMIVTPTLIFLWFGRLIDRALGTGVQFSAALLMLGAAFGLWSAWRWMHRQ